MNNNSKEPLFHIVKRGALPWYKAWGIRLLAVVIALIVCAIVTMTVTGENPIQVYATMIDSSFGSERKVWILAQNTAMLLGVSLAVTPAFRMRFWNIGGEGQILAGCLAAAACMICLADTVPERTAYRHKRRGQHHCRCDLGRHSRVFQSKVEH